MDIESIESELNVLGKSIHIAEGQAETSSDYAVLEICSDIRSILYDVLEVLKSKN